MRLKYTPKTFLRINILRRFMPEETMESLLSYYVQYKKRNTGRKSKLRIFIDSIEYKIIDEDNIKVGQK